MKGTLYALTRTKEDIDEKQRFKLMLTEVSETGAVVIDGANIAADSIYTRHLRADSVVAEHIKAGEITTDHITAGSINADRLAAHTITSTMIHTEGLSANVIKTGKIIAGNNVSVIDMANGEFSLAGGKLGYVAATDRLYIGAGTLFLGGLPIEEHNRMVGSRQSAEIQKTAITNEKQALDARYTSLYNNSSLTGTPKTELATKYSNVTTGYTTRYNSLVSALNEVIAAPTNTTIAAFATLQSNVATATSNHTTAVFSLNTALELASKTIENAVATKAQADATTAAALDATTKTEAAIADANSYTNQKINTSEAKTTGAGKWIGKRYNKPDGVRVEPSFSVIKTLSLAEALEVADTTIFAFGSGANENYIGHWATNVYVATAKTVSFSAIHDDGFAVYLNGKRVAGTSLTTTTTFDLVLVAGWNQVDLLLHEMSGGDKITLNKLVGANVDQLSCYLGGSTTTAEVLDVTNSLNTLSTTMTGSFKDGLLTAAEKSAIAAQKNSFVSEKSDLDAQYNSLKTKLTSLTLTTASNTLITAYGTTGTNYVQKYTNLITALDAIINTPDTTSSATLTTLKTAVTNAAAAYATQLGLFSTALEAANQAVADKLAANALASANQNTTNVVAETVPYSIVFSNENQSIPTDAAGVLKGSFIFGSDILVFRGSTRTSGTIGTVVLKDKDGIAVIATGGTASINVTQPTASITGKVEVLFSAGANLSAEMGYLDVPITVNGVVYNKRMTWNKAKDGEASRFYNLTLNTPSLQAIPGGGYSPATIGGSTSTSIGTDTIVSQSGYYLVYEQSRDSITLDAYNALVAAGQVALGREYIISDVAYPFVKRYTSSATEYNFSYTPNENITMVLVEVYADSECTNLLDYQSAPVIYEGQSAYGMQLMATNGLVFKFDQFNANKGMANTVLTPVLTNITNATYAWKLNGSATVSATTPTVTVGYSALNNVDSIKYLCEVSGTANGVSVTVSDTVTVSKVKDGSDTYNIILTNESVNIPTAENGTSPVLTGANTNVKLYYGTVAKTPTLTLSSQTGGTATIDATDTTKVSIATVTADAGYIDILVKDDTTTVGTKRFSFARSKQGVSGRSITAVDVEYYLSTSKDSPLDGSWSTTAWPWTTGKYMWSRTKTTYSTGSPTYSNPACITGTAGQIGGTGTGITSITEEYNKSTSKTTEPTSGWQASMPTWTTGNYVWTRSKIIYSNPTSTVYTTAYCDSSWEAVNEIKIGGTNLWPNSAPEKSWDSWATGDTTKSLDTTVTWNGKPTLKAIKGGTTTGGLSLVVRSGLPASTEFTYSFMVRSSVSIGLTSNSLGHMQVIGTSDGANVHRETSITYTPNTIPANVWTKAVIAFKTPAEAVAGETFQFRSYLYYLTYGATFNFSDFQLEYGNKASDWSPAPEDVVSQIETKSRTFTSTPVVPYNSGDIWRNGTSVYVCSTARSTGFFLLSEWTLTADKTTVQRINDDPDTQRIEGNKMHFTNEVLMDNAWIDNLVANSIVATKIQATELNAGKITAGTLSADRIAVGSLSGDKITANTIDATRLKIGSGAQGGYINNPRFSAWSGAYPDGTSLWSAGGISKVTVDTVPMAQFAPTAGVQQGMQLSSSYFANGIDLDGMQYFALECRFRLTSGTNPAGASFLVDIYRQDNSYERMQLDMKEVATSVTTNTWYVARKVFKLSDANVAKTFKSISGYLLANFSGAGDAAKTIQFASVNMFQASAQEFLAQSWTNGGTTSINGGFIATGTLSADKITTGSLNASLITTGNLDAARITAGVISAGNGKSTINMSTGAFSFGSGKIAFDGTTLSLNVDSLKITNSSVATQTYASGAAATAKTEAISAAASDATSKADGALSSAQTYSDKVAHVQVINGTTKRFTDLGGLSVDAGSATGYIIIQTPITSSYMSRVHISGYNYVGGQSNIDLYVSFYAYSNNTFLNYDFVSTGSFPIKNVLLARNGSNVVIIIGTGTTAYSYPRVVIDEAILGFSTPPDSYVSGWSASIASTYSAGYTNVTTLTGKDTFSLITAVESDINDLESATTALQNFTNTSFADGIIQRAEAQAIAEHLNSLTKENADVINQYNSVYPNALLEGTAKTNLSSAKTGYDAAYSNLVTSINTAISDNITSSAEKADVDAKFGLYGTAIKALTKALSEALVAISAKQAANAQAAAASDATSKVNSVEVGGRNLWIQSEAIAGYTVVGGGTITASTTNHQSMETLTPILAGKKLIYQVWNPSKVTSGNSNRICYFNSSGTYISQVTVPTLNGTDYQMAEFIAPANTASARLAVIQGATAFDSSVKIKFEIGTKATGWTPAPEDVEIQIEAKADNQDVSGNLNTVSTAAAAAQAAADAKLDASAYNDFLVEYASFKDAQAAQSSTASASLEAAKSSLASITNEMGSMKESWVFNNGTKIDATGSGMLLSDEAGGMNLLLSNNRISFFDSGVEVAYIADKTLKINHGIFVKSAQIGAHAISQSPSNPDITIVTWVGI